MYSAFEKDRIRQNNTKHNNKRSNKKEKVVPWIVRGYRPPADITTNVFKLGVYRANSQYLRFYEGLSMALPMDIIYKFYIYGPAKARQ